MATIAEKMEAIADKMEAIGERSSDRESVHAQFDELVCEALELMTNAKSRTAPYVRRILKAYNAMPKWYS